MKSSLSFHDLQSKKGFTLIEILLVIAIIAILSAIVIIAINPSKQLAESRNAQRRTDVNTVLNAVYQYAVDTNGTLPASITTVPTAICATGGTCTGLIDLSVLTANEKYLVSLPKDPTAGTANSTGYNISKSANGRVTVSSPASVTDGGLATAVSVTR